VKLISFRAGASNSWGRVIGDEIVDLSEMTSASSTMFDALQVVTLDEIYRYSDDRDPSHHLRDVTLLPPIVATSKIICVGLNFVEHEREMRRQRPPRPTIFSRFPDTLVGGARPLIQPAGTRSYDYEGELAVVIGATGRRVAIEDTKAMIAGYTLFNDGSLRDYQRHSTQFTPGKNFPQSGAIGPWIVTPDEVGDLSKQTLTTRLNGHVVQQAPLSDMIFSIPEIISYCSEWTELRPGDILATGTPGGVGAAKTPPLWMTAGDVCEVSLPAIGVLSNPIIAESVLTL